MVEVFQERVGCLWVSGFPPRASVSLFVKEVCRSAWGGAAREAETKRACSDCLEKAVLPSGSSVDSLLERKVSRTAHSHCLRQIPQHLSPASIHRPAPEDPGTDLTGLFTLVTVMGAQAERLVNEFTPNEPPSPSLDQ